MKKSYETIWEIFNKCPNNQMRDVFIDEIETDDCLLYTSQLSSCSGLQVRKENSMAGLATTVTRQDQM